MIQILVVDDEDAIAQLVKIHLELEGYAALVANDANTAMKIFNDNDIALAILDIMMPGIDGITLCKMIREKANIPIIMLSAKTDENDKVEGLVAGADDYISKPFGPKELIARVQSQLRRYTTLNQGNASSQQKDEIVIDKLVINKSSHSVTIDGNDVKLTPTEFKILDLLAESPGKVFSTDVIFESVWNEKMFEANNTVMVHIRRIREKLSHAGADNDIIKTVWGVGYKIDE